MINFLKKRTFVVLYSNLLITLLCTTGSLFNGYYLVNNENNTNDAKQLVANELEPLSKPAIAGKVVVKKKVTYVSQKKTKTSKKVKYVKPAYSAVTGEAVVNFAKQFIGLKYVYAGRSLSTGTDCSGFTSLVYKEFGVKLGETVASQLKSGKYVKKSDLQKGDLVFYGYHGKATHVAMYIGNGRVIHESTYKYGCKTSPLNMMPIITTRRVINQAAINKVTSTSSKQESKSEVVENKEENNVVENTTNIVVNNESVNNE